MRARPPLFFIDFAKIRVSVLNIRLGTIFIASRIRRLAEPYKQKDCSDQRYKRDKNPPSAFGNIVKATDR